MGIGRVRSEGWYSPASNVASFSLSQPFFSSESTAVYPLIWQQFFHTGLLKRKAPIPLWFLVGLAAGFDSSATLIEPNHSNLSVPVTASLDFTAKTDWDKMISEYVYYFDNEKLYFSDFRNESWGLHWYLINKNKAGYEKYWKAMSELTPLDKYVTEETLSEFKTAFGKPPKFYKPLYVKAIKAATKSNPNRLPDEGEYTYQRSSFGVAKMRWLDSLGQVASVNLDGTLTNKSPIRARCFCVGCVTAWGKTATWFIDNVEPNQTVELPPKRPEYSTDEEIAKKEKARKKNAGLKGADYPSEYWIKSVPIDSPEAEKWRKGELPSTLEENE